MKNFKTLALALFVAVGFSATAQTKKIDTKTSQIKWIGEKVTGKHDGTVGFKEGSIGFSKGKVNAGTFVIDMNSITVLDLAAGQGKEKLEGHLKNDDFFGVDKHPTATIVFKKVTPKSGNVYTVNADLTIKGKTAPVTFDLTATDKAASTSFKVDRSKYDVKYGSNSFFDNLGDKAIYDDFHVSVNLVY